MRATVLFAAVVAVVGTASATAHAEDKAVSDDAIRDTVNGHMTDLKACMNDHGDATGKLVVEFTILPDGKVSESKVGSASSNKKLDACIAASFRKWTFPRPRNGKAWVSAYPIQFAQPKQPAKGTLTEAEIVGTVKAKLADVQACLAEAHKEKADAAGTAELGIVVSSAGAVSDVKVLSSTTKMPTLDQCIVAKVKTWTFPKPKGGGEAAFKYPFKLEPTAK